MAARKSDREDGRMENKMEAVIEVQGRTCRINPLDCGVGGWRRCGAAGRPRAQLELMRTWGWGCREET